MRRVGEQCEAVREDAADNLHDEEARRQAEDESHTALARAARVVVAVVMRGAHGGIIAPIMLWRNILGSDVRHLP
jgi:hypothetical protein